MRLLLGLTACLVFAETSSATPESHARIAADFLEAVKKNPKTRDDAKFLRFLSFYNLSEDKKLAIWRRIEDFWINNLHLESDITLLHEVRGTNGTLVWLDLRDFGWNKFAFSAVARREPYFTELAVNSGPAMFIRQVIQVNQDPKTLHLEGIVRADWFFRETVEQDRSTSYLDLLFASRRFIVKKTYSTKWAFWPGGKDADGVYYPRGTLYHPANRSAKFVNFPKNEADFEKIFGVDDINDFARDNGLELKNGAVVEGGEKFCSIVSRQNRLVERKQGKIGPYYKTFDVKETTGLRDFIEQLNKGFKFEAGEILAETPAGGIAALLIDNKGTILTTADNRFATDKSDIVFDARVRTAGSCFICHENGWIKPQNVVAEMMKAGIDIQFKNRKDALNARRFFLNWDDKLEADQKRFSRFIERTSGFKPGENAKHFKAFRDLYDAPVDLKTAAREVGLPVDVFKLVALRSTKARILGLLQGITMPRKTWEIDGYKEVIKLLNARKLK